MNSPIGLHTITTCFIQYSPPFPPSFLPFPSATKFQLHEFSPWSSYKPCLFIPVFFPCFFFPLPHSFPTLFLYKVLLSLKTQPSCNHLLSKINLLSASTQPIPTQNLADTSSIAVNQLYCPSLHICLLLKHPLPQDICFMTKCP